LLPPRLQLTICEGFSRFIRGFDWRHYSLSTILLVSLQETLEQAVEAAVLKSRAFKTWTERQNTRQLSKELQSELG
jgi:hypothetical protein